MTRWVWLQTSETTKGGRRRGQEGGHGTTVTAAAHPEDGTRDPATGGGHTGGGGVPAALTQMEGQDRLPAGHWEGQGRRPRPPRGSRRTWRQLVGSPRPSSRWGWAVFVTKADGALLRPSPSTGVLSLNSRGPPCQPVCLPLTV